MIPYCSPEQSSCINYYACITTSHHHNSCGDQISNKSNSASLCLPSNNRKFVYYLLFVPKNAHTHIYIYIYY